MDTLLEIAFTSIIVGFFYRGKKLLKMIKGAFYSASFSEEKTLVQKQELGASAGCLGCLCLPFFVMSLIALIYLFFKVDWWIPVVGILSGLSLVNLLGYGIERMFQLPDHQIIDDSLLNLNSIELSMNEKLYRKALGVLVFYNIVSFIIALILIIGNEYLT